MTGKIWIFLPYEGRVSCCKVLEDGSFYLKKELFAFNVLDVFSSGGSRVASEAQRRGKTAVGKCPMVILPRAEQSGGGFVCEAQHGCLSHKPETPFDHQSDSLLAVQHHVCLGTKSREMGCRWAMGMWSLVKVPRRLLRGSPASCCHPACEMKQVCSPELMSCPLVGMMTTGFCRFLLFLPERSQVFSCLLTEYTVLENMESVNTVVSVCHWGLGTCQSKVTLRAICS